MNKSFRSFRRPSKSDAEEDIRITKKKKTLIHGKLLIDIKEARGKKLKQNSQQVLKLAFLFYFNL